MFFKHSLPFLISTLLLTGCQSSFGPQSINNTHAPYNQAIADTANQQMLLNLVRLKYRDEMFFLKVGSVTSTFTMKSNIGADFVKNLGLTSYSSLAKDLISPALGMSYSDIPTISYLPLQGEDFFKSVLSPISLDTLLVMIQSGWNIDRVFNLCVERVNDLYNSPSSAFSSNNPEHDKFSTVLKLLRSLQLSHSIEVGLSQDNLHLMILFRPTLENQSSIDELQSLLGIKSGATNNLFRISSDFLGAVPNQITINTRGISSIMHYLAQTVISPDEHIKAGLVEANINLDKKETEKLFQVNVS